MSETPMKGCYISKFSKNIDYPKNDDLFKYVDYILSRNGSNHTCQETKISGFYKDCGRIVLLFYNNEDSEIAEIQFSICSLAYSCEGKRSSFDPYYHLESPCLWNGSQGVRKVTIINELNKIRHDILTNYFSSI